MDLGLDDRVYVVSGGSRGLGFATAQALVEDGANVVLLARDPHALRAATDRLGDAAVALPADLADPQAADAAVAFAIESFGRLDGGLISVGGPPSGSVLSTTDDQWRAAFESVFLGSIRMARALCAGISGSGQAPTGSIAFVLSTSAVQVHPGLAASNGLRPGLAMLVKDLSDEVGPLGIRVNGLLPGRMATDRLTALAALLDDPELAEETARASIPLRRNGTPDEFGRAAAFILSPAASYVTGTLLRVDGGATRHP
jgi:3-oxoacyl-[acyl-carrier protein] reductase